MMGACTLPAAETGPGGTTGVSGKPLRVGVAKHLPPLSFEDKGRRVGLEVDLAMGLGEQLGRPVRFVAQKEADLIPALLANKIDIIMSGLTATTERAVRVSFTSPYLQSGQTPLVRVDNADSVRFAFMRDKLKVGYQRGTTGALFVERNLRRAVKVPFSTAEAGARSLAKKKIDVFVHDAPVNQWLASSRESEGLTVLDAFLTNEPIAWAVRKDDAALLSAANDYLRTISQDGRLTAAILRWLGRATRPPG